VIVDAHAHVFRPAAVSPRGVDELAPAERDEPVEGLLSVMAEHGAGAAVLVPVDEHDDYVRDVLGQHLGRFAAVAVAGPADQGRGDEDPVERLRRRRRDFGFHALRTRWLGTPGRPVRESPFFPVLRVMAGEGLCLWTYLDPDQAELAVELAFELPGLTMVLNHLGLFPHEMRVDTHRRPWFDDPFPAATRATVRRLARHPNVLVMFSGQYAMSRQEPPYADLDEVVHEIAGAFGASRMLWASDFPWTRELPGYAALLDLPRATFPSASPGELADIRGGTALRVFPHLRAIEER
jgi:predicted TIM-barrel fold metal-dependent hydrolase